MARSKRPEFVPEGLASIRVGLEEIGASRLQLTHPAFLVERVEELWRHELGVTSVGELREFRAYRLGAPDWFLGMTDEFRKGIAVADRRLQGRILEAISYIARTPLSPKGDTVKARSGELKELWRYRIGD